MTDQIKIPQLDIVSRMYEIPVVSAACSYASNFYGKAKDSNPFLNKALTTAESTVGIAAEYVAPVAERFQSQIKQVDDLACQGLQIVEANIPLVKQPPQEILKTTTMYLQDHVQPARTKIDEVHCLAKSQLTNGVDVLFNNQYRQLATTGVNTILDKAEGYLDVYLPDSEQEDDDGELTESASNPVTRAVSLTNKTRHRLSKVMSAQLKNLKFRSEDVSSSYVTVDLIQYAKDYIDTVKTSVNNVWVDVSPDDSSRQSYNSLIRNGTTKIVQTVIDHGKSVTDSIIDRTQKPRQELVSRWSNTSVSLRKVYTDIKQDGKLSDLPEAVAIVTMTSFNTAWDTIKICTVMAYGVAKTFIFSSSLESEELQELYRNADQQQRHTGDSVDSDEEEQ